MSRSVVEVSFIAYCWVSVFNCFLTGNIIHVLEFVCHFTHSLCYTLKSIAVCVYYMFVIQRMSTWRSVVLMWTGIVLSKRYAKVHILHVFVELYMRIIKFLCYRNAICWISNCLLSFWKMYFNKMNIKCLVVEKWSLFVACITVCNMLMLMIVVTRPV